MNAPLAPASRLAPPAAGGRRHPASFRDPCGFVYRGSDGMLRRHVNPAGEADYRRLMESGLYERLVERGLLIEHQERPLDEAADTRAAAVLAPRELPFISHPYEWPFSMLQDAALATIEIERAALAVGMTLKDASAYNIQFEGVQPRLIDTLSLAVRRRGEPWRAYGQFCRHFLAPLALMACRDVELGRLGELQIDGVELDLASRLLPARTWLRPGLLMHLHLHARSIARHNANHGAARPAAEVRIPPARLDALLEHLAATVQSLRWRPRGYWASYYQQNSYTPAGLADKQALVAARLADARPRLVWDLGANTGVFSRLAAASGADTIAWDLDPACVEANYRGCRGDGLTRILPLRLDLTNPSPARGWAHVERASWLERGPADVVLALAVVHHLALGNNTPLPQIVDVLAAAGRRCLVEFVPKSDPQAQRLLAAKGDLFPDYTEAGFRAAAEHRFRIVTHRAIGDDGRVLFDLAQR